MHDRLSVELVTKDLPTSTRYYTKQATITRDIFNLKYAAHEVFIFSKERFSLLYSQKSLNNKWLIKLYGKYLKDHYHQCFGSVDSKNTYQPN